MRELNDKRLGIVELDIGGQLEGRHDGCAGSERSVGSEQGLGKRGLSI